MFDLFSRIFALDFVNRLKNFHDVTKHKRNVQIARDRIELNRSRAITQSDDQSIERADSPRAHGPILWCLETFRRRSPPSRAQSPRRRSLLPLENNI